MTPQRLFEPGAPPWCCTEEAAENILTVYRQAHALEVKFGTCWYWNANRMAHRLALIGRVSVPAVCHVIAALSPNSRWEDNMRDAEMAVLGKRGPYRCYKANLKKAKAIIAADRKSEPFKQILKGPKVSAFAHNIQHPRTAGIVTIDAHAYSVAHLWRFTTHGMVRLTEQRYSEMVAAYVAAAATVGLKPHQLQAITWVTWKRKHSI